MLLERLTVVAGAILLSASVGAAPPKLIFAVVVDDLGWNDVGFHQAPKDNQTSTPAMDALAASGVILDRHYVHHMCTPSRCSFLSGRLPVHVQQQLTNPEAVNGGIPRNMTAVASKMKAGGFATAIVGKWDAGMSTPTHTPEGRGFDQSLIYYDHKNDYYTNEALQTVCTDYAPIIDLWSNGGPAYGQNGTGYEEYVFRDRVHQILSAHDFAVAPLFLVYAPHVAHCPLQVPKEQLDKFAWLPEDEATCQAQTAYIFPGSTAADYRCRAQYQAMVNLLDGVLGNLTDLVKSRGLWEETLMVLSSDNGGPEDPAESGANNWPLKGAKYADWEGGIRATAFVSGGYLPAVVRGTVQRQPTHIADWYTTFAAMAGQVPADPVAARAGLPPVDGLDLWPLLSGANATSPRQEIPVSTQTLVQGPLKLVTGPMSWAGWSGPQYPNASSASHPVNAVQHCPHGCLYDVVADPHELHDLAAASPETVANMSARLTELKAQFFSNNDTGVDTCPPGTAMPCACWVAINRNRGFFGPFQL